MNKKIDKAALAARILGLEGISSEDKSALLELLSERSYGLYWEYSPEEVEALLREKLPVLTEDTTKRILADATDEVPNHILIEGDNYPALVALQYAYEGKVDVIYIDPPYNTGNKDFVYNDSYVDNEDGYRHSKWLSFMSKRLNIAKRLLSDRGVIFISIDDNEQANLKLLCDKVFRSGNFISSIVWRKQGGGKADSKYLANNCEYILCYRKNSLDHFSGSEIDESIFNKTDENGRKYRLMSLDFGSLSYSASLDYPITLPNGIICYPDCEKTYNDRKNGIVNKHDWCWRVSPNEYEKRLKAGKIEFTYNKKNDKWKVQERLYLDEKESGGLYGNLITDFTNRTAKNQLKEIFDKVVFNYPKPTDLIIFFLHLYPSRELLVLDFFAGSGTTLHATMQLNAEDGGHRQCILVTNNENNICEEVTYERNKRVIQGYTTPKGQQVEGLKNNNLRYYKVDFVEREKTAANQKELMKASTDLLCIKENLYQEEKSFEGLKLHEQIARCFTDGKDDGKKMLIIYEPAAIPAIVKRIEQMTVGEGNKLKVYVMAEGQYPYTEDFETVLGKIELRALPHALYQAMRQVLPPPAEAENSEPDMEVSDEEADGSIYKSEEL